jgi:hypothetical protein
LLSAAAASKAGRQEVQAAATEVLPFAPASPTKRQHPKAGGGGGANKDPDRSNNLLLYESSQQHASSSSSSSTTIDGTGSSSTDGNDKDSRSRQQLKDEHTLRELRICLSSVLHELLREKRFGPFWRRIDPEEWPEYFVTVTQPMDLETVRSKVDAGVYLCLQDFMKDVELIKANTLATTCGGAGGGYGTSGGGSGGGGGGGGYGGGGHGGHGHGGGGGYGGRAAENAARHNASLMCDTVSSHVYRLRSQVRITVSIWWSASNITTVHHYSMLCALAWRLVPILDACLHG